jgi:diguanylate cyclase (GGDEF)-like protein
MRELAQAYAAHRLQGLPACLLSFDVDHFRAINDGLGHTAGDQALRDLAAAVSGCWLQSMCSVAWAE